MPFVDYFFLALICGFLAVLGDLIESFLKRCAAQKDTGTIFQSMGGFLDRIDSMTLIFPFLAWFSVYFTKYENSPEYSPSGYHLYEIIKILLNDLV